MSRGLERELEGVGDGVRLSRAWERRVSFGEIKVEDDALVERVVVVR